MNKTPVLFPNRFLCNIILNLVQGYIMYVNEYVKN